MKASVRRPFFKIIKRIPEIIVSGKYAAKLMRKIAYTVKKTTSFSKKILAQKGRATIHIKLQTKYSRT
jgi:hypothetical protein